MPVSLVLWGHPFSSYCWKAAIALDETATPFDWRIVDGDSDAEFRALWPLAKFPVLVDGEAVVAEASVIVEYLDLHHGPVPLIPADRAAALDARFMDRVFDLHVQSPMQAIVGDAMRGKRDPEGVERARAALDTAYAWLDARMAGREWAAGDAFGLADCAAAPALFYADWVHPIAAFANLRAYRARLLARPSVARAVEGARPFRHLFPLGAPDRD